MTISKLVLMLVCLMPVMLGPQEAPKEADHGRVSSGQLGPNPSPLRGRICLCP
jgi:hypothetical protein